MGLLQGKVLLDHLSWMELYWTISRIVRNKDHWRVTIKDTDKMNHLSKAIFNL
jgi:hypothetical protein